MSKIDDRIEKIKIQLIGNTGARVFLVEGPDDVDAYRIFLDKKFPGWEAKWHLVPAGNKSDVVDMARKEPDWLGLVDCDEWTEDEMAAYTSACPNLKILPRFCLESYLIDPAELWQAFSEKQRLKIPGGEAQLRHELLADLQAWIRHAALWHGVRPLWRQLRILGFPDSVLASHPMLDDDTLRLRLRSWHELLNADAVLARVHAIEANLASEDESTVFTKWLYAKNFYPRVVHQVLNRLLGQESEKKRRLDLLRGRTVPADLDMLWQAMGLQP
jgi:hypothetical protein